MQVQVLAHAVRAHVPAPGAMIHVPAPGAMGHVRGPGWARQRSRLGPIRCPGWKYVWNQKSRSPDQFWGPCDPFGGDLAAMEAEGRLIGGLEAEPPGKKTIFFLKGGRHQVTYVFSVA